MPNDAAPKPSAAASALASASAPPTKEPSFVMPPPSVSLPMPKPPSVAAASAEATLPPPPTEIIERPPPKTLARGRYEAKPGTIWTVVGLGVVLALLFVFFRLRAARKAKERQQAALLEAVRRAPTARA